MRYNLSVSIVMLVVLSFFSINVLAHPNGDDYEQPASIYSGFRLRYYPYQSFSQTKTSFPFRMGYPAFHSDVIAFEYVGSIHGKKINHFLHLNYSIPSSVTSDDGLGNNYLLETEESTFSRFQVQYYFTMPLIGINKLEVKHGPSVSLFYEKRNLTFLSGRNESQWDFNPGIGPFLDVYYPLNSIFSLRGQAHFLFYLPYLSSGEYSASNTGGELWKTDYHFFIYSTHWDLGFTAMTNKNMQWNIGYRKTDQVGFGNSTPSLKINETVTYKLERFHEFYLGVIFRIK